MRQVIATVATINFFSMALYAAGMGVDSPPSLQKLQPASIVSQASGLKTITQSEIPLTRQSITLGCKIGDHTVITFPFEIKDVSRTSLVDNQGSQNFSSQQDSDVELSNFNGDSKSKTQATQAQPSQDVGYGYERGVNTITLYGKTKGEVSFVVWGYDYPILFKASFGDKANSHYEFEDTKHEQEKVQDFESDGHEKSISQLVKSLVLGETPAGYKANSDSASLTVGKLKFSLNRQLVGNLYLGQEWIVENTGSRAVVLDEELLYETGIYAIAFEEDALGADQKTRAFVVRAIK